MVRTARSSGRGSRAAGQPLAAHARALLGWRRTGLCVAAAVLVSVLISARAQVFNADAAVRPPLPPSSGVESSDVAV